MPKHVLDENFAPVSALQFQPKHADIFMTDSKGQTQRLIFTAIALTEYEQEQWDKFIAYCSTNNLELPEMYRSTDRMLLRYLQATKFDYAKAQEAIMEHFNWVKVAKPNELPGDWCLEMLNQGYVYLCK